MQCGIARNDHLSAYLLEVGGRPLGMSSHSILHTFVYVYVIVPALRMNGWVQTPTYLLRHLHISILVNEAIGT